MTKVYELCIIPLKKMHTNCDKSNIQFTTDLMAVTWNVGEQYNASTILKYITIMVFLFVFCYLCSYPKSNEGFVIPCHIILSEIRFNYLTNNVE